MRVTYIQTPKNPKELLQEIGVDSGAIKILSSKIQHYCIKIDALAVGGANILKQDALSIGADLAVPRGTVIASIQKVDCILIATKKHLEILSKKELSQPFGLKEVARELAKIVAIEKEKDVKVMGVINANDDSFFSQSRYVGQNAIDKVFNMVEDGANIIDIGGVSSRPNALKVSVEDELQRVKPLIDSLYESKVYEKVSLSIDSYEPQVISYALEKGFHIVNDITGLINDDVVKLCASYNATAVIMHMKGTPQTMQDNPSYSDVISDVYDFLQEATLKAESMGVKDIVLDVGIGFGKTLEHNIALIKHLQHFKTLQKPLLIGASRKSMIDKLSPSSVENRLAGTLAIHLQAVQNGASILRVHDVKEHIQALTIQKALL